MPRKGCNSSLGHTPHWRAEKEGSVPDSKPRHTSSASSSPKPQACVEADDRSRLSCFQFLSHIVVLYLEYYFFSRPPWLKTFSPNLAERCQVVFTRPPAIQGLLSGDQHQRCCSAGTHINAKQSRVPPGWFPFTARGELPKNPPPTQQPLLRATETTSSPSIPPFLPTLPILILSSDLLPTPSNLRLTNLQSTATVLAARQGGTAGVTATKKVYGVHSLPLQAYGSYCAAQLLSDVTRANYPTSQAKKRKPLTQMLSAHRANPGHVNR